MAFIEIGFNTKRPLILGRGGFGTQLNDWLMDEGWGSADFLDDNAPDVVGGLRDYVDPAILKRGRPAFVALGDNKLRVELLQKLAAAGYSTPVFISDAASVSPSAVLEPGCIILPQAYVGADAHLSAPAPCWSLAASSCRRRMSVRTPIWAWAASSTREPSWTTTPIWAAACMWLRAASSRPAQRSPSSARSIPARSCAPRGRTNKASAPRLY